MVKIEWSEDAPKPALLTLADAKKAGLTLYFTGLPCKNGHTAERYTVSSRCCICSRSFTSRNHTEKMALKRGIEIEPRAEKKQKAETYARKRAKFNYSAIAKLNKGLFLITAYTPFKEEGDTDGNCLAL